MVQDDSEEGKSTVENYPTLLDAAGERLGELMLLPPFWHPYRQRVLGHTGQIRLHWGDISG